METGTSTDMSQAHVATDITDISSYQVKLSYSDYLWCLYLFAEIKPGKTLSIGQQPFNIRGMTVVDHNFLSSWCRWWYNEDKKKTMASIQSIIYQVRDFILSLPEEESSRKETLNIALLRASDGIKNLTETYKGYPETIAEINSLLAEIREITHKNTASAFAHTIGKIAAMNTNKSPEVSTTRSKAPFSFTGIPCSNILNLD